MRVSDILFLVPDAGPLLTRYGLHCFGCVYSGMETLREGCMSHGFDDADVDALVIELNELLASRPARPRTLTVTKAAAEHLLIIARQEHHERDVLEVVADERGGFCMEFRESMPDDADAFGHPDVELRIAATALTLARIGGATIDFRNERFALDLPEDASTCCGGGGCEGGCGCSSGGHKPQATSGTMLAA